VRSFDVEAKVVGVANLKVASKPGRMAQACPSAHRGSHPAIRHALVPYGDSASAANEMLGHGR
jgi:hypothetical protein